jgi:membrane dipeptidase
LLEELMHRGWTDTDIAKVAGENVLRVMTAVEKAAQRLSAMRPPSSMKLTETKTP